MRIQLPLQIFLALLPEGLRNLLLDENMADINTVITKITDALNEAYAVAGLPSVAAQLTAAQAANATLTADLATRTQERDDRQTAINNMKAAAQADKAADAANAAGQGVLDAAGTF